MFISKKKHDAITRQWDLRCADLIVMRDAETKRANGLAAANAELSKCAEEYSGHRDAAVGALEKIAAQATSGANATVKRMARIAEDAAAADRRSRPF